MEGVRISSITIQKILNDSFLGMKSGRWLALEQANAETAIELTAEQAAFIEKLNPCFRERHVESSAPGELLVVDTFFVGSLKGIGRVYLHAVVDSFGSYAFGLPHVSKQPEAAVAVLTDNDHEFWETKQHPYELYFNLNDIEHRRTNCFVKRFYGTVLDKFFRVALRDNFYNSLEALQADLAA